jgi:hypothetical protein
MRRMNTARQAAARVGIVTVFSMVFFSFAAPMAYPWGGEHHRISAAAIDALPQEEQAYLAPERSALAKTYCTFPDTNWPCYGQWGGSTGDPKARRMPDTRRLWGISFYCQWDPVLQKGKGYPHAPPRSWEAAQVFFLKAADSFAEGRLEDGSRFLGVMMHYLQDSGAFPHVQPIHRAFHVQDSRAIRIEGYSPRVLGRAPEEAGKALADRVERLTDWTEKRLDPLITSAGMPIEEAKRLASKETMPAAVIDTVGKLRREKPAEYEAAAVDCANECTRVCADAIHSALAFAQKPYIESPPHQAGVNLVFNPSFEECDGDAAPAGWCVDWLDTLDRMGRADWYRAGTHYGEKHVRTGGHSALLLWPPKSGLEWQQTWPQAVKVRPGEKYRGSVWGQAVATAPASYLALEFSDTCYQPVSRANSASLTSGAGWQQLSVDASVPEKAHWMRIILHAEGNDGATWYDDTEVVRVP